LDRLTLAEARQYHAAGHFHKGSMGPKIDAAISYLERGGQRALITNPENLGRALNGETGTWIVP
jgi:carbamate kinase